MNDQNPAAGTSADDRMSATDGSTPAASWMNGSGSRLSDTDDGGDIDSNPGIGAVIEPVGARTEDADEAGAGERVLQEGLDRLREEARRMAVEDAKGGDPAENGDAPAPGELSLRERCRALFERWLMTERRRIRSALTDREETVSELLGRAGLLLDRFDRYRNEIIRLKARRASRRRAVEDTLADEDGGRDRGLPTKLYLPAIGFLGLVEFFANAPVFSTLLPRDPLTERQIQVLAETSTGWMAGAERVLAQLVLRPDAALLAAGVVTFLCVLAHFFGHSLRELVMQQDRRSRRDTVETRSPMENAVPLVLTGLGLALVLGVLFEARVILGDVGERRFRDDIAVVEELRREAGWLRTDGELLAANERTDRADDMEEAATQLREYAASMSRMTFPILLLNVTLVLAAITAAYFHNRDATHEYFNESLYEDDRERLIQAAEATTSELADVLHRAVRPLRELQSLAEDGLPHDPERVVRRLESAVVIYRSERARIGGGEVGIGTDDIELGVEFGGDLLALSAFRRAAEEADREFRGLVSRFREGREEFNAHLSSWEAGIDDA